MTTTEDVVAVLANTLCQRIGEPRYNLWFAGKTRLAVEGGHLQVGVPNLFLHDWLQKTFGQDVQGAAREVLGAAATVRFAIEPALFQSARDEQASAQSATQPAVALPRAERRQPPQGRRLRSLDDFVVGPSNRVAHASAVSLVEHPEETPLPLVLHGPVGVGKTHLLEGICAGLSRQFPDWRILLCTAEDFTNRFLAAMHQHKLGSFRKQFRDCDALLVDDVGFLAGKKATQEEFLHTIDSLVTNHRPVVLSCDCHPRMTDGLSDELADRLVGGAAWSVSTPDRATRLDLLRARAESKGGFPHDVLEFLADHLRGNVRELEGAVHGVVHLSRVTARPIDVELAREALGDLLRHSLRQVSLEEVERAVCDTLGISRQLLFAKKRQWIYSYPRMLAMYLARKHTSATYSEVGKRFGGRNHSTAVAGEKKARRWLDDNITLQMGKRIMPARNLVELIERELEK